MTLDLYDARSLSEVARPEAFGGESVVKPGRFGLSCKKEAAGAARRMLLPMGFEC